jgi:hypothetical protein
VIYTPNAGSHALREALYELSMAQEIPDPKILDEIVRRYPQLGDELTDFAIALALDALREPHDQEAEAAVNPAAVSAEVGRAMKRFQERLKAQQGRAGQRPGAAAAPPPQRRPPDTLAADAPNPFASLDRTGFRALAERLNVNSVFVVKLRDRQIDPGTMPTAFQSRVAEELDVPLELLQAHFAARQSIHAGSRFKADGKPQLGAQQSFEEAVRNSGLTPDQQQALLDT